MKAAGCFPRRDSKELLGAMVSEPPPALSKQITRAGTSKQVGERKRSLIDANTKWKADPERVRERMLLIQMLLNTDPLLPANLDKKDAVGKLSAVEMRRKSDDDVYPWVATIV